MSFDLSGPHKIYFVYYEVPSPRGWHRGLQTIMNEKNISAFLAGAAAVSVMAYARNTLALPARLALAAGLAAAFYFAFFYLIRSLKRRGTTKE